MKKTKAYLTVEAALVMPLVIFSIVLMMYLLFFQYDRCLMEQRTALAALRCASLQTDAKKQLVAEVVALDERDDRPFVAWEAENVRVKMKGNDASAEGEGSILFPFYGYEWNKNFQFGSCRAVFRAKRIKPVNFIRNYKKVLGGK